MFTFIKKVIKTGTATHAYPLEPMPVEQVAQDPAALKMGGRLFASNCSVSTA